ncbi:MAG: hypothetical protein WC341_17360 [Bacteroidales bacterium]|jgi:hypothetical protein
MASTQFTTAVFIDSLFVKQTILETCESYPELKEEDISLESILSRIIDYTGFKNYQVFYFEIPANHLRPDINKDLTGETRKISGKQVKFQMIEANLIAPELIDFFIQNQTRFEHNILVGDDVIYSGLPGGSCNYSNLIVFRRRESTTRMNWDLPGRYAFFEDMILEICKDHFK